MGDLSGGEILALLWGLLLAAAGAVVVLGNAADKITGVYRKAKAPNDEQDKRIQALEDWKKEVDRKLSNDRRQLEEIHEGLRASYQAQLALLDHGIDGNNLKQMEDAKHVLQKHLISR